MAIFGNRIRVGDLLVQKGYITDDQLSQALEKQREEKGKLGEVLINMGLVTEEQFSGVICAQLGIESVDLKGIKPDHDLMERVGEDAGVSKDTVRRYIRLTELIPEIRDMVDEKKIALREYFAKSSLISSNSFITRLCAP